MPAMNAPFRALLTDWDLHDTYGHYLDHVPGVTLLSTNVISMFGLHRRWRGALVGHLAMFEMTSSVPNARYAQGHRRLGRRGGGVCFDEHVVADSVHDQIALHDLAGGLAQHEPQLVDDIVFGARCAAYADAAFARHVFARWGAGASSLRRPVDVVIGGGGREPRPGGGVERGVDAERRTGLGVSITVCPDGSLLVRGPVELVFADRRNGGAPPSGGRAVSVRAVSSQTALRRAAPAQPLPDRPRAIRSVTC